MTEDPGLRKAIETVQKLLNLANNNPNEAEATAAMSKAQALMEAYAIDQSTVERASGKDGKREEAKNAGGLYQYQRDLWHWVAELNFCVYWTQREYYDKRVTRDGYTYNRRSYRFVHRIVGRTVNVATTKIMAEYLEGTIERLTRERLDGDGTQFFTRWAVSYREGMAARICQKLYDRREHLLSEEKRKEEETRRKAQETGMTNASTSTAMTLGSVIERERDANTDFLYGEGTSARRREQRAKRAEATRLAQEEYTRWAQANPEEARAREAKAEKEAERASKRRGRADKPRDWGAYSAGYDKGDEISIDQQAGTTKVAGVLR